MKSEIFYYTDYLDSCHTAHQSNKEFKIIELDHSGHNREIQSHLTQFKISLIPGRVKVDYGSQTIVFTNGALLFSDTNTFYQWESEVKCQKGYSCIFSDVFFNQLKDYKLLRQGNISFFDLAPAEINDIDIIYKKMIHEYASESLLKTQNLKNLIVQLIQSGLRLKSTPISQQSISDGSLRITSFFRELLEKQFPIHSTSYRLKLRFPADLAGRLAIHVNHLNRSLKEVTGQTTSQLIAERIATEARGLLRHTDWSITEISYCLGFEELPQFIHFFKKTHQITPKRFRNQQQRQSKLRLIG